MSPNVGSRSPGAANDGCAKSPEAIAVLGRTPFTILGMICVGDLSSIFMVVAPLLVVWTLRLHEDRRLRYFRTSLGHPGPVSPTFPKTLSEKGTYRPTGNPYGILRKS